MAASNARLYEYMGVQAQKNGSEKVVKYKS